MPEPAQGPCISKVERCDKDTLHVVIPPDMLHKFYPGMEVEVIEVRKKTITQETKPPLPCRECGQSPCSYIIASQCRRLLEWQEGTQDE